MRVTVKLILDLSIPLPGIEDRGTVYFNNESTEIDLSLFIIGIINIPIIFIIA